MQTARSLIVIGAVTLASTVAAAQSSATATAPEVLATVRLPVAALANGKPLPAGVYGVRLTKEAPAPLLGQSPDAARWVEFIAGGAVVAREAAEVLRDDDLPETGASAQRAAEGVGVAILKGGEFLRISVKRNAVRYLIHLPIAR